MEKETQKQDTITLAQAAEILNRNTTTVWNYVKAGTLTAIKPKGKPRRVYRDDVLDLKQRLDNPIGRPVMGDMNLKFNEVWKFFEVKNNPDYNTSQLYMVSNYGRVVNAQQRKELAQSLAAHGYKQVPLARGSTGDRKQVLVHKLVALLFCRNIKGKAEIHHINGENKDNRASNLIWVTSKQHGYVDSLLRKCKKNPTDMVLQRRYDKIIDRIRLENYCKCKVWEP